MRTIRNYAAAFATAIVSACGGSSGSDGQAPAATLKAESAVSVLRPMYSSMVSFGDSLSDVGTYAVGAIKAAGGGKFTINAVDARIWIEHIALQIGLPVPCAAQTGLNGDPAQGYSVPITKFPECTAYAQGGARVSEPNGPGSAGNVGALTDPVATQIQNYLAAHAGRFSGTEAVFVMAGANDLFVQLASLVNGDDPIEVISEMIRAGMNLGKQVRSLVAAGATRVVVVNLPDASTSPIGQLFPGVAKDTAQALTRSFNAALRQQLLGAAEVLYVDAYTQSQELSANPAQFGLTNTTTPACDLSPEKNPLGSSLICTAENVVAGPVDRYEFADNIHPTPYAHLLLAELVSSEMAKRGWLQ
jgi:outer membrane lipase/esterase